MKGRKPYSIVGYKIYFLIRPIFKYIFRIEVEGLENIPKDKGCIIAANHRSYLDPPVLNTVAPKPFIFLAKKELFDIPIFSWFITKAGALPLYRGRQNLKTIKRAIELINEDYCVAIFPEGGRMPPKKFGKAHSGVGLLVAKTKAPVIPTKIEGTDDVLPIDAKFPKLCKYKIKVKFGKPLDFSKLEDTKENHQLIANKIMETIKSL